MLSLNVIGLTCPKASGHPRNDTASLDNFLFFMLQSCHISEHLSSDIRAYMEILFRGMPHITILHTVITIYQLYGKIFHICPFCYSYVEKSSTH